MSLLVLKQNLFHYLILPSEIDLKNTLLSMYNKKATFISLASTNQQAGVPSEGFKLMGFLSLVVGCEMVESVKITKSIYGIGA